MNNYIPLNKAGGSKVICDGYHALIPQKLGVDAMTFNFDGSECEHATCAGAPEMFIKVEEDGLYLDQLDNYAAVARFARGRRVLDCFCNQGGFALACALAGASEAVSYTHLW